MGAWKVDLFLAHIGAQKPSAGERLAGLLPMSVCNCAATWCFPHLITAGRWPNREAELMRF